MNRVCNGNRSGTVTLILGGVRSGKSQFGQSLAHELGGDDVLFVATAEARDAEMSRRIDLHRRSRPANWLTLEQSLDVGKSLDAMTSLPPVVLIDCLTLLVSNLMHSGEDPSGRESEMGSVDNQSALEERVRSEVSELLAFARRRQVHLIIVSGEVGMGVVPEHRMGRLFRDLLGRANQWLASQATSTYLMVAGLPVNMTAIASNVQQAAHELRRLDSAAVQA